MKKTVTHTITHLHNEHTYTHTHTHTLPFLKLKIYTESLAEVIHLKGEILDEYITIRSDQGNLLKPV